MTRPQKLHVLLASLSASAFVAHTLLSEHSRDSIIVNNDLVSELQKEKSRVSGEPILQTLVIQASHLEVPQSFLDFVIFAPPAKTEIWNSHGVLSDELVALSNLGKILVPPRIYIATWEAPYERPP